MSLIDDCDVSSREALSIERIRKVFFKKCKGPDSLCRLRRKCVRLVTSVRWLIYLEGITSFERLEVKSGRYLLAGFRLF